MIKASLYCAGTAVILTIFEVIVLVRSEGEILDVLLIFVCVAGILGFIFCILLLLPLKPIFDYTKPVFSLVLFMIVGFSIPAYGLYTHSSISWHGEIASLDKENNTRTVLLILYSGFIGAMGAASAWCSLKRDANENA